MLEGSGGNIAVLTGPDGKVLIDAGIRVSRPQLTKALADLGADPVTHLVNTHWHFDHADGNEWLHSAGARIIAQENTRKHLAGSPARRGLGLQFPSARSRRSSQRSLCQMTDTLKLNGASINLKYYGPAHTDSDISVTFAEANVVHVGDTFWNGIYPFIDYSTGGSIDGMIAASTPTSQRPTTTPSLFPVTASRSATGPNCRRFATCLSRSATTSPA